MLFKDYKHIELLEEITIPEKRVSDSKIVNVKNWKPTNPYRLRVKATVVKNGKRTIKKRTYVYEGMYMVEALKEAGKELDALLTSIRDDIKTTTIVPAGDKDEMFTFES
ncbi:hypothetical protein ACLHDG_08080 [Sulfurovum sp. CS9]|uniref:hypothetical protein n=1 Tax=Sulfurovum sp. CS9 TaxID=3391146 RepID=UPI0039E78E9A